MNNVIAMKYKVIYAPLFIAVISILTSHCAANDNTGYFWQLTDVHYDSNYSDHTVNKTEKLCLGELGDYKCDSPWRLVESAIGAMKALKNDVDLILWTGDSVPHAPDSELNGAKVFNLVKNVTDLLKSTFPKTHIFPVLGNHDVWPANDIPVTSNDYFNQILSNSGWNGMLSPSALATFKQGGYYVEDFGPWRIFGLNTVIWYNKDTKALNATDPGNQTLWLQKKLFEARNGGKKVLLVGHVPPGFLARTTGVQWFYDRFNSEFHKVLVDFSNEIQATIFGHEHTDSFRVVYDAKGLPVVPVFLAPAVTPWKSTLPGMGSNNPSIRLYKYDNTTGEILDYVQYFLNLSKTKSLKGAKWEQEYSLKESLTQTDASAKSLHQLLSNFAGAQSEKFDQYYRYNSVSYDVNTKCDGKCKLGHLCGISCIDKLSYQKCMNQSTYSPVCGVPKDQPLLMAPSGAAKNDDNDVRYYLIGTLVAVAIILAFLFTLLHTRRRKRRSDYANYPDYARVPLTA